MVLRVVSLHISSYNRTNGTNLYDAILPTKKDYNSDIAGKIRQLLVTTNQYGINFKSPKFHL